MVIEIMVIESDFTGDETCREYGRTLAGRKPPGILRRLLRKARRGS